MAFSYPSTGLDGQRSVRVDMTARSSGDAKWYFDDVPVTPGQAYTFADLYTSNVLTSATIRYRMANGSYTYAGYYPAPAAATASPLTFNFTPPANAVSATVFHLIAAPGFLVTDAFSVSAAGTTPADTTSPTVSVTSPAAGSTVSGTVTLTADASDNVGIVGVKFLVDGTQAGAEDTAAPYQLSFNTGTLSAGSHTVTAVARDAAGNSTTSAAVAFTVAGATDTTAPTVSVISPAANATVSGTITLAATASDNVGVAGVRFLVDGTQVGSEDTSLPYQTSLNTAGLSVGIHTVTAIARDAAGNTTTSAAVAFAVADTTAPTVAVTAPVAGATVSATTTVSAQASDNVAVVGVKFLVDGTQVGSEVTAAPFQFPLNTTTLANGSHNLTAVARDAAGNTRTSAAVTFTVANGTNTPTNLIQNPSFENTRVQRRPGRLDAEQLEQQ